MLRTVLRLDTSACLSCGSEADASELRDNCLYVFVIHYVTTIISYILDHNIILSFNDNTF